MGYYLRSRVLGSSEGRKDERSLVDCGSRWKTADPWTTYVQPTHFLVIGQYSKKEQIVCGVQDIDSIERRESATTAKGKNERHMLKASSITQTHRSKV